MQFRQPDMELYDQPCRRLELLTEWTGADGLEEYIELPPVGHVPYRPRGPERRQLSPQANDLLTRLVERHITA